MPNITTNHAITYTNTNKRVHIMHHWWHDSGLYNDTIWAPDINRYLAIF